MNVTLTTFIALAIAAGVGFVVAIVVAKYRGVRLKNLLSAQEDLVGTERRMFTYLHDLGSAIAAEQRESVLYRLIVEGAIQVTSGAGGALYTHDEASGNLVPRFVSATGAPLMPLTAEVLSQNQDNPYSLLNSLRLQSVPQGGGLLGDVFLNQRSEFVVDMAKDKRMADGVANEYQSGQSVLISPLTSGSRRLGVLAVTLPTSASQFDANDLEVFAALAEQSAFALASAVAHLEVQHKRKLEAELRTAGAVQRILLPDGDPVIKGFSITGRNRPATILSGDFYEYVRPSQSTFGGIIADVSGKGFPAALIAACCRSALQAHAQIHSSPVAVLSAVNRQIFNDINQDMFVSAIYFTVEEGGGTVLLARAGHPAPMIWRAETQSVEIIQSPGLGLGIDAGEVFDRVTKEIRIDLAVGDVMLLYTDGINEAENSEGEEFGEQRLSEVFARHAAGGSASVIDAVLYAIDEFSAGRPPLDDVTLVVLQRTTSHH